MQITNWILDSYSIETRFLLGKHSLRCSNKHFNHQVPGPNIVNN